MGAPASRALNALREFHDLIDEECADLLGSAKIRSECKRGCNSCCADGLSVLPIEAERIRSEYPELLAHGLPYNTGVCAFQGPEGECLIYSARPATCRMHGLPQIYSALLQEPERRTWCPLNGTREQLLELPPEACLPVRSHLEVLSAPQFVGGGFEQRIPLRSLFRCNDPMAV